MKIVFHNAGCTTCIRSGVSLLNDLSPAIFLIKGFYVYGGSLRYTYNTIVKYSRIPNANAESNRKIHMRTRNVNSSTARWPFHHVFPRATWHLGARP